MRPLRSLILCSCGALFSAILTGAAFAEESRDCPPDWQSARPAASELTLCWRLQGDLLRVRMSHPGNVWLALGFGKSMADADAIVARPSTGEVLDMSLSGYDAASVVADARQNLVGRRFARFDGKRTTAAFSRALDTGDRADAVLFADAAAPVMWAAGAAPGFDGHFARGMMSVHWGKGAAFAWSASVVWHAILMGAAFGLLMPLGVMIARYYKVRPGRGFPRRLDDQFWWRWHQALQYGGMSLAAVGFFMVWNSEKIAAASPHAEAGYAALVLAGMQVVSGILRGSKGGPVDDCGRPNPPEKIRGDHYDMTPRRRLFEFVHKIGGYAALAAGFCAIALGAAHAEMHWSAFAALATWLCFFAGNFAYLQKSGRWTSTYHAIWGMDARHPGNRPRTQTAQKKQ